MAQEERNRLVEWLLLLRSQVPVLRRQAAEWVDEVREEPRLIWETPAVRYFAYGFAGLVLLLIVSRVPALFGPPLPPNAKVVANTADYHVICTDENCRHHFVINRKFGFHGFPVECPKCKHRAGYQAIRCACGRWVVPETRDGKPYCPACGQQILSP